MPDISTAPDASPQHRLPGEREWLRSALLTDRDGMLTETRARLGRIARARGMLPHAVDDVVQETLLEAWNHLDRLHTLEGFKPWIDEICRNVCRRTVRRQQQDMLRTAPMPPLDDDEGSDERSLLDRATSTDDDPAEELTRQDMAHLVDQALGTLPLAMRQLLELTYLLDLPRDEVAERLHISSGTLDTRLHRARRELRRMFNGPLREDAEGYGLALGEAGEEAWQPTRLWCPHCSRRRLEGMFVRHESTSGHNLHLRCPACAHQYGRDTVHSMGLVSLADLHAIRPAWKRTMQALSERVLQALADERHPCLNCGYPTTMMVCTFAAEASTPAAIFPFGIRTQCSHCGERVDTLSDDPFPSMDQLIYWSNPRTRQFVLRHQRWATSSGDEVERDGTDALALHLTDLESSDRLTVVAERRTLRILALE